MGWIRPQRAICGNHRQGRSESPRRCTVTARLLISAQSRRRLSSDFRTASSGVDSHCLKLRHHSLMRCGCCPIFVESVNPCTLLCVELGTGGGDFFSEIGPGSPSRPSAGRPDAQPRLRSDGDPCPHNGVHRRCDYLDEETTHHSKGPFLPAPGSAVKPLEKEILKIVFLKKSK